MLRFLRLVVLRSSFLPPFLFRSTSYPNYTILYRSGQAFSSDYSSLSWYRPWRGRNSDYSAGFGGVVWIRAQKWPAARLKLDSGPKPIDTAFVMKKRSGTSLWPRSWGVKSDDSRPTARMSWHTKANRRGRANHRLPGHTYDSSRTHSKPCTASPATWSTVSVPCIA